MISPARAAEEAEKAITRYAIEFGPETPEEVRKLMEMLISKAARGVEKYCGLEVAIQVLARTIENMERVPPANSTQH